MLSKILENAVGSKADMDGFKRVIARTARAMISTARSLQLEYGHVVGDHCDVPPHNPAGIPYTQNAEIAANKYVTVEAETLLGKVATRGHIVNLGNAPLFVNWQGFNSEALSPEAYELAPGDALSLNSFFVRELLITARDEPVRYQLFLQ